MLTKEGMFNKEICVVVQGPIDYIDDIIKTYEQFKNNVIISTNDSSVDELKSKGFTVLVNPLVPAGRKNFNNQVNNTLQGILKAKELGFKYVLKIRADLFTDRLEDLINSFDLNKVYFPAYHNHDGGYLCEHMIFGEIGFMKKLWSIPISLANIAPETQITAQYDKIRTIQLIDFIFPILYDEKIMMYWKKYNFYLNDYESDKLFTYEEK